MPDTTMKIRAKGCDETGITEELATKMHRAKMGKRFLAIVELQTVEPHGPTLDGKRRVDAVITQIEPAQDERTEETLRELTRAMSRQRRTTDGELPLDNTEGTEPSLDEVNDRANALIERDEDGKVTGIWDGDPDSPISEKTEWGEGYPEGLGVPAGGGTAAADDSEDETDDPEPEDGDTPGNVVNFSGKG